MAFWTIEEVAEHTGLTVTQVYESRRRKEWPGVIGTQRGRRLMFDADRVKAGPEAVASQTTDDVQTAILWTLQGIESKLGLILKELRLQRPVYFTTTEENDGQDQD